MVGPVLRVNETVFQLLSQNQAQHISVAAPVLKKYVAQRWRCFLSAPQGQRKEPCAVKIAIHSYIAALSWILSVGVQRERS